MSERIDQDETTRISVPPIGIVKDWLGSSEFDSTNIIHVKLFILFIFPQAIDIHLVGNL